MTVSVQMGRTRSGTKLIGGERLADPVPDAATEVRPADSAGLASSQTRQAGSAFRKRRQRGSATIDPAAVAARINRLFDTIRPPGRGPLRNFEVLSLLRARGIEMSAPYLSQLRGGRRSHPSLEMLGHLADVFGVSVTYFTDGDTAYTRYLDDELGWLETAHDPQVRELTTALLTLAPDAREGILQSAGSPCTGNE